VSQWKWKQKLSEEIFHDKYMINDEKSEQDVFSGVAKEVASAEKTKQKVNEWQQKFYDEISTGRLIPAGRILANARPNTKMPYYNNCYTIDIEDTIEGIGQSQQEDLIISATGGGVGINFSKLRPKGASLSKGGKSSGVISFMKGFNQYAKVIETGGSRRAAHIGILNIDHPEIEDFIVAKQGDINKALTQFNISVGITDEFINCVKGDKDWDLKFNGKVYKTVKAKDLYELMTKNAFEHNEPGILNLDIINKYNNGYYDFNIESVNPCGEIVMPPYSLCCLSSVNLTKFISNPFTDQAKFDFDLYKETINIGIRFLDNVLDVTKYPLEKIETLSKKWRRVGLGFTGLGNVFTMLKIKYGSEESKKLSHLLGKTLRDYSYKASIELAKEKGMFDKCDTNKIVKSNFIKQLPKDIVKDIKKYGLRNIALNTTAPTGATSLSLGNNCSSGIEPTFSLYYDRSIRTGVGDEIKTEKVYDYAWLQYLEYMKKNNFAISDTPDYFVTTFDVNEYDAIDIQAIFQKYIDHSISKTLNLPTDITYENYNKLFMYAYDSELKGFTTFNSSGSVRGILNTEEKKEYIKRTEAPTRPDELECDIHEITVQGKKFIILVGKLYGSLYEIFLDSNDDGTIDVNNHKTGTIKKNGKGKYSLIIKNGVDRVVVENLATSFDATYGVLARFISMGLRHGTPLQFIVDQLNRSKHFLGFERAVSRVLKKYIKDGEIVETNEICPECGNKELRYQEGCLACTCGWSKCS